MAMMAAKNEEEEKATDGLGDVVEEVHEWTLPLEVDEGNPDPEPVGEKPKAKEFEVLQFTMKNTISKLKAVAAALRISTSENKGPIFNRIRDLKKRVDHTSGKATVFSAMPCVKAGTLFHFGSVTERLLLSPRSSNISTSPQQLAVLCGLHSNFQTNGRKST